MRPLSAKNAKVRIDGAVFTAKSWSVVPKTDKIDTTNFEGGGFAQSIHGIESCEVSVEADWDGDANPFDSPPNVQPNVELVNVRLFISQTTGPCWVFPLLNVFEAPNSANVREAVKISFKAEGNGTFTYPTGSA